MSQPFSQYEEIGKKISKNADKLIVALAKLTQREPYEAIASALAAAAALANAVDMEEAGFLEGCHIAWEQMHTAKETNRVRS